MNISDLSKILNAELIGANVDFSEVSIDTRTLKENDLYIAIKGDCFDGHDFCQQAQDKGASAEIVSVQQNISIPQLVVSNTRKALMKIAQHHRDQMNIPVIGITGSCGKTTVRAMMESVLKQNAKVLASIKSYNNDIGVPLTLLQLNYSDQYAVIEMGANHAGEIAELTNIVKPTVAILTCAAKAHLAGFGSLEGISRAKGEIFQGLQDDGVAIINEDDQFASYWKSITNKYRVMTFGLNPTADIYATDIEFSANGYPKFKLHTPQGTVEISLPLMGVHNVRNAAAVAAAALAINIPLTQIEKGLTAAIPESGRLVAKIGWNGATVIDDSYNANPTSVAAAIDILTNRAGESVLVLADMLEMGDEQDSIHYELGKLAREKGLKHMYCFGPLTKQTSEGFGAGAKHFDNKDTLIQALKNNLTDQMTVLVKGSNSMGMKHVVEALLK